MCKRSNFNFPYKLLNLCETNKALNYFEKKSRVYMFFTYSSSAILVCSMGWHLYF